MFFKNNMDASLLVNKIIFKLNNKTDKLGSQFPTYITVSVQVYTCIATLIPQESWIYIYLSVFHRTCVLYIDYLAALILVRVRFFCSYLFIFLKSHGIRVKKFTVEPTKIHLFGWVHADHFLLPLLGFIWILVSLRYEWDASIKHRVGVCWRLHNSK